MPRREHPMSTEPIVRSITVSASPEDAFRIFTAETTSWWPLQAHTRGDEEIKSERVVVQERVGGRSTRSCPTARRATGGS